MALRRAQCVRPRRNRIYRRIVERGDREEKEFLIHFPLYMGVKEVWVGVDADASVAAPAPVP